MRMIEYVPISIAKKEYEPEPRMVDGSDFRLREDNEPKNSEYRHILEIFADYLEEKWGKDFIKRMEGYNNVTSSSN